MEQKKADESMAKLVEAQKVSKILIMCYSEWMHLLML